MGSEELIFGLHSRAMVGENHEISFHIWEFIVQKLILGTLPLFYRLQSTTFQTYSERPTLQSC